MDFRNAGTHVAEIPVEMSYRILELFSGGLYSSPTKAVEELVANSYDAYATCAHVIVSSDLTKDDSTIMVIDDGESMDLNGLQTLWKVGYSPKDNKDRSLSTSGKGRLPIGKFGIGKLATWVLARELTYICRRDDSYLAVTMNYRKIDETSPTSTSKLLLAARSLSVIEAENILKNIRAFNQYNRPFELFGNASKSSWTVAILSDLKSMARELKLGRLRWVIATAMPLVPDFKCVLNDTLVEPSKVELPPLQAWIVGKEDKAAANLKLGSDYQPSLPIEHQYGVILSWGARITGFAEVYEDTLDKGKSEEWGRSHGFFVMVRNRLINLHDALFGNTPLSHKTFNRFRMVVHCDGLDEFLLSSREGVSEKDQTSELRAYLRSKLYEVGSWYENWLNKKSDEQLLATRLGRVPLSLMRRPLVDLVIKALEGKTSPPRLTRLPTGLTVDEKERLIEKTKTFIESQDGFIGQIVFESLGTDQPIALFDAATNRVVINDLHPFYRNYQDYFKNPEPFEVIGVAEILTEAYLLEGGMDSVEVNSILRRRDDFFRELVYMRQLSAPLTADLLREAGGDPDGLERAAAAAFRCLGYVVTPIGGSDEPDGLAEAHMVTQPVSGQGNSGYSFTYDAKSTKHKRAQSGNVHIAAIDRHRKSHNAQYAVIVAKDFSDTKGDDAAIVAEARNIGKITMITTGDLARLVEIAATKRVGYQKLRTLFEECCTASECRKWIDNFDNEQIQNPPIREMLYAIYQLQKEQREAVEVGEIRILRDELRRFEKSELREWLHSISRLVPEYITIRDNVVELQQHPDRVLEAIGQNLHKLPSTPQRDSMLNTVSRK